MDSQSNGAGDLMKSLLPGRRDTFVALTKGVLGAIPYIGISDRLYPR